VGVVTAPRVLVLGAVLSQGRGGVWRHNRELLPRAARLLSEAGGGLAVLEGREPPSFELPPEVERLASKVPPRPVLRRALAEGHALRRLLAEREAEGRPFDLVHTAHLPVPRGAPAPLAILLHDLRALRLSHTPFSRRLIAREVLGQAARRARVLMTVSETMAEELATELDVERASIHVVPNAGDHLDPLPRRVTADAPLLCIGHLEPRKRPALLVEALAADPGLPDVHFLGAAKGEEDRRLRELAGERGVAERLRFLGAVNDGVLRRELAGAACVVLPSELEGFGIVALEAQVAGAPLALSDIPAHREVAPEAVFFGGEGAACARAVREALARDADGLEAQRCAALERYSWEDSARRLVEAWRAAVEGA